MTAVPVVAITVCSIAFLFDLLLWFSASTKEQALGAVVALCNACILVAAILALAVSMGSK